GQALPSRLGLAAEDPARLARRAVEQFCDSDFRALPARDSLAIFSPGQIKAHRNEAGWPLVDWVWDPLTIVASYRVGEVTVADSMGSAPVDCAELARAPGAGNPMTVGRRAATVTFGLRWRSGCWRVFDPPEARVSPDSLVGWYASALASVNDGSVMPR